MVWRPPRRAYGAIIGYDVNFLVPDTPISRIVHKTRDELHHIVSKEEDILSGPGHLNVQVSRTVKKTNQIQVQLPRTLEMYKCSD